MDPERLDHLLERYFDQLLEGDDLRELERMLLESPAARGRFWEVARMNASLRQWGQEEWGRRDAAEPAIHVLPAPPRPSRPYGVPRGRASAPAVSRTRWWPLAAAALVVLGLVSWFLVAPQRALPERGVAILTSSSQAVWGAGRPRPRVGSTLTTGWLDLKAGAVQVDFLSGARVVLEGPAAFRLVSDNEGELRRGKLAAVVPEPARGFKVRTKDLTVVDYGTEFGCIVPENGTMEVHVFAGEVGVEIADAKSEEVMLTANEAVRFEDDTLKGIPADAGAFLDERKLARLAREGSKDRLSTWERFSRKFRDRPDLVAYMDFQPTGETDRSLPNRAVNAPPESGGAIVGCTWAQGRWPGKGALEFKGVDDRVRMTVPGTFESLTFMAWIRVEETPNRLNSLVMGEVTDQLGDTHWYVYRDGALGMGVRIEPRRHRNQWWHAHTDPVFVDGALNTWTFVATVFDRAAGKVTHYVNGRQVGAEDAHLAPRLRLGTLEIGNWGAGDMHPSERGNFRGSIDEVAILDAPLDAREIREIYQAGRP